MILAANFPIKSHQEKTKLKTATASQWNFFITSVACEENIMKMV